ncbi:possible tyrosine transporter P-protein [Fervidobacterium changbaicum]|uniref:Citrate transporter n=2 Tax=Fervidobacterium TaxID=2422 RepID=A0AAI8CLK8_FERIS|nr:MULTISPECIES: SLC13 family permease [Fervidobacterium]AMW32481.1 citrate transporter [Fervidobacterium islandicum]QAV32676.1 citrate transporter [Fervidobacterium changbaicum]SDH43661.1 possible tyrosine transporter P-protein [Fervidobacterium changbaicum]
MISLILVLYAIAYAYIIFEPNVSSVSTLMLGLVSVLLVGGFDLAHISKIVDFNTLFILIGMMTVVAILKEKGVFVEISRIILILSRGKVLFAVILINIAIFLLSSFLDNVTTILIFIPILFYTADALQVDSKPILINALFFSNLGGVTTAIGDPPNIIIYSASRQSFVSFIIHLMPVGILTLFIQLLFAKRALRVQEPETEFNVQTIRDKSTSDNWLYYLLVFTGIIVLMMLHEKIRLELGIITMLGAMVLLFVEKKNFQSVVGEVDWDTLSLITGLYFLNFSLEHVNLFATAVGVLSRINVPFILALIIFWSSLFLTGFLSALPVTMIYLAIIKKLILLGAPTTLYWALALGVGIGGNLTPVASMCNIVGNNLLKKLKDETLSFIDFTKSMLKPVLLSGIISSVFLIVYSITGF